MTKKVHKVTDVTTEILKKYPPVLAITCKGEVPSSGWTNGRLIPFVYIAPPADGIYEFDFVADEPTGTNAQVISEILAETYYWDDFPQDLKGVKINSSTNSITR
jgi:hypothetical protein